MLRRVARDPGGTKNPRDDSSAKWLMITLSHVINIYLLIYLFIYLSVYLHVCCSYIYIHAYCAYVFVACMYSKKSTVIAFVVISHSGRCACARFSPRAEIIKKGVERDLFFLGSSLLFASFGIEYFRWWKQIETLWLTLNCNKQLTTLRPSRVSWGGGKSLH